MARIESPLARAKGLGSAKDGVHHWWMLRLLAVALIPLTIWFIWTVLTVALSDNIASVAHTLSSPIQALLMILFIGTSLYHAMLGMREIIEDYVHCGCMKITLLILVNFVSIVTILAAILAIAYTNIHGIS